MSARFSRKTLIALLLVGGASTVGFLSRDSSDRGRAIEHDPRTHARSRAPAVATERGGAPATLTRHGRELASPDAAARRSSRTSHASPSEVREMIEHHMEVSAIPFATRAEGDAAYADSLERLRENEAEAVRQLTADYQGAGVDRYALRWIAASTLAELGSDHAYPALREIAFSPMPKDLPTDPHDDSARMSELTYRMVTTDGLATLARNGNTRAEADLLAIATDLTIDASVRARAIKGYLGADEETDARAALLEQRLPKEDHWAITLDTTTPEEFAEATSAQDPPSLDGLKQAGP